MAGIVQVAEILRKVYTVDDTHGYRYLHRPAVFVDVDLALSREEVRLSCKAWTANNRILVNTFGPAKRCHLETTRGGGILRIRYDIAANIFRSNDPHVIATGAHERVNRVLAALAQAETEQN